jgi:hypothetical protein
VLLSVLQGIVSVLLSVLQGIIPVILKNNCNLNCAYYST